MGLTVEATHYIKKLNTEACICKLNRITSIAFVDLLYKRGAISVEVAAKDSNIIAGIIVRVPNNLKVREVLTAIFKANPDALEEIRAGVFRVQWNF